MSSDLRAGLDELAAEQGVEPVRRIEDMADGTWPDDESVDDFLAAIDGEPEGGSA